MGTDLPAGLTGSFFVRVIRPAFQDAKRLFPKMRDRAVLRRHGLKLRFWPENHPEFENGLVLDLDWSWIKSLTGKRIGELRIQEQIGGCSNLRIIFYVSKSTEPFPTIWTLAVFQKKRDDFTKANLETFLARRTLVLERFYRDEHDG